MRRSTGWQEWWLVVRIQVCARRLVISAAEDIGLANPNALLLANACFETLQKIGWPEGRIVLAETHALPGNLAQE